MNDASNDANDSVNGRNDAAPRHPRRQNEKKKEKRKPQTWNHVEFSLSLNFYFFGSEILISKGFFNEGSCSNGVIFLFNKQKDSEKMIEAN